MSDTTSPPLRLSNPYAHELDTKALCVRIPIPYYRYFFNHVLAGNRGAQQCILGAFFEKFYQECLARGIPQVFDENADQLIAKILHDLNFCSGPPPRRRPAASAPKRKGKPTADSGE